MSEEPILDGSTLTVSDFFVAIVHALRPDGDDVILFGTDDALSDEEPGEGRVARDPDGGFYVGDGDEWIHSDDIGLSHFALEELETVVDDLGDEFDAHVDESEEVHGAGEDEYVALTDREDQAVEYDNLENVPEEFAPEEHGDEDHEELQIETDFSDHVDESEEVHGADEGEYVALTARDDQAVDYGALENREHGMDDHDETVASSDDVDDVANDLDDHEQDTDNPHETTLEDARAEDHQLAGDVDFDGNSALNVSVVDYTPVDVRTLSDPEEGWTAYHDGSDDHTEGPAHYDGTDWISTVDGTVIDD